MAVDDVTRDDDLTIRGDLDTTSVPELVRSILNSGETGVLTFRNSEFTKSLYVQVGTRALRRQHGSRRQQEFA